MPEDPIKDEEYILRRIPNVSFQGGKVVKPSLGQKFFKIRADKQETGISCNREILITAVQLCSRPEALPNSWVARARVGDLEALGLKVVLVVEEGNPGHCEITSDNLDVFADAEFRDQISNCFTFVEAETTDGA